MSNRDFLTLVNEVLKKRGGVEKFHQPLLSEIGTCSLLFARMDTTLDWMNMKISRREDE